MIKDRERRYETPAELIIDLECLNRGEPPKLARPETQYATLEELAKGETEPTDTAPHAHDHPSEGQPILLIVMLLVLLGLSVLLNLILLAD